MHILCFVPALTLGKGGAERVFIDMAEAMTKRRHKVTIVGFCKQLTDRPGYAIPEGGRVMLIPRKLSLVRAVIQKIKPDILFSPTASNGVYFWYLAFQGVKCPTVLQEIVSPNRLIRMWSEVGKVTPLQAVVLRNAFMSSVTKIRLVMPSYVQTFASPLSSKVSHFYNAIRVARRPALMRGDDGKKMILNVGGLKANKNIMPLLSAFSVLSKDFPDWYLVVCGEGPMRKEVEDFLEKERLAGRVILMGNVDDIYALYEQSQFSVLTSLEEGCPLAICESMVHGLPSIGYADCTGTNELIKHENNGLLVESGLRVENLVSAMRRMMGDVSLRQFLSGNALSDSVMFSPESRYDDWEQLFFSALKCGPRDSKKIPIWHRRERKFFEVLAQLREDPDKVQDKRIMDYVLRYVSSEFLANVSSHAGNFAGLP